MDTLVIYPNGSFETMDLPNNISNGDVIIDNSTVYTIREKGFISKVKISGPFVKLDYKDMLGKSPEYKWIHKLD